MSRISEKLFHSTRSPRWLFTRFAISSKILSPVPKPLDIRLCQCVTSIGYPFVSNTRIISPSLPSAVMRRSALLWIYSLLVSEQWMDDQITSWVVAGIETRHLPSSSNCTHGFALGRFVRFRRKNQAFLLPLTSKTALEIAEVYSSSTSIPNSQGEVTPNASNPASLSNCKAKAM